LTVGSESDMHSLHRR